jgi:hypothetical protein
MVEPNTLLEGFLKNANSEFDQQKVKLIRILSRTATLPKVADLQVQFIHSQPEMFIMEPGKQLRIGVRLLEHPILALVALRYGIEWHIWHNAVKEIDNDCRIADLAAAVVTSNFVELLPNADKEIFESGFPEDLVDFYSLLKDSEKSFADFTNDELKAVSKFHNLVQADRPINEKWFELIQHLAIPTERLLMSGGDVRMNIDGDTLLNVYGCRPFPRPEAFTFASSTATSVSNIAFDATQLKRIELIKESAKIGWHASYSNFKRELKSRLLKSLELEKTNEMIFAPSGTDVSLLFSGMSQSMFTKPIRHVLVASDESGSGVPLALKGHHFANTTAFSTPATKGKLIDGFDTAIVDKILLRDTEGRLKEKSEIHSEIRTFIESGVENNQQVVLHVMDQSKLGYASPDFDFVLEVQKKFDSDVLVMVDNSQLRMTNERISSYLKNRCWITLTGSKFFTGPPFCGALIIPDSFNDQLKESRELPNGLSEYFPRIEFEKYDSLGTVLPEKYNLGSYLRWTAAITEMERYFNIPLSLRELGSDLFCEYVEKIIDNSEFLEALEKSKDRSAKPIAQEQRTIFPFFIKSEGKVLSHPETDRLYRLLNKDISKLLETASSEEKRIAKIVGHIGQPVKVKYAEIPSAILRISLGSRVLAESWKDHDASLFFHGVENQMNQVNMIVQKINLILKYKEQLHLKLSV